MFLCLVRSLASQSESRALRLVLSTSFLSLDYLDNLCSKFALSTRDGMPSGSGKKKKKVCTSNLWPCECAYLVLSLKYLMLVRTATPPARSSLSTVLDDVTPAKKTFILALVVRRIGTSTFKARSISRRFPARPFGEL